ncbi:MAG: GGDEF domain-containing protein, partial [Mesorhizobium sp.]
YHDMFQVADRHLYKAKANGRDQVSFESRRSGTAGNAGGTMH